MKICFVANNVYTFFFSGLDNQAMGGAEYQQKMIGKALRRLGYVVSFISHDHGQPIFYEKDGLIFIKSFQPKAGLPVLRFFYPRLSKLWQALKRADADIYYVRGAGFLAGILAIFCRLYNKKFVYAAASDMDFIPNRSQIRLVRDRQLYYFGLKRASAILVQSERQQNLLLKNYSLKGILLRNYYEIPRIVSNERKYILWVSNIRYMKQPMKYVDLAERFPQELFIMIGGPDSSDPNLYELVRERCSGIANLEFLGFRPIEETEKYFNNCKVFVNTSEYEGFPNTFMQSWSRGVPIISSVDPDGIISHNGLGIVAMSDDAREAALRICLTEGTFDSQRIINYVKDHHCAGVINQLCTIMDSLHSDSI